MTKINELVAQALQKVKEIEERARQLLKERSDGVAGEVRNGFEE